MPGAAMRSSLSPTTRFQIRPDVLARELDGEAVLLDLASGRYFGLNATGRRTFELLDGERTVSALIAKLAEEFGSPPELPEEVEALLLELERERLLDRRG